MNNDIRPIDANALIENAKRVAGALECAAIPVKCVLEAPTLIIPYKITPSINTLRDEIYQDAVAHGLFEEFDKITDPVRKRRKLAMRINLERLQAKSRPVIPCLQSL